MRHKNAATIRDIASILGVSTTTVHKALYNKKGISVRTKQKILDYVEENNFQVNKAASALKRRAIRLAAVLIEPVRSRRFFYADILLGVDKAMSDLAPFNVELVKHYTPLEADPQVETLEKLLQNQADEIDGLLIVPAHEQLLSPVLNRFSQKGIKTVTVNSDTSVRDSCVASDTLMSGRLAGELICALGIAQGKQIILIGGNRDMYNHQRTAQGFIGYMREERPNVDILEIYDSKDASNVERMLRKFLMSFDDIAGIYCNTSANSLNMCRVIEEMGLSQKLSVIGSDVFHELMPYFDNRTLTAAIYQNPILQGYEGMQTLYRLVRGENDVQHRYEISTGIAFRSNVRSFLGAEP